MLQGGLRIDINEEKKPKVSIICVTRNAALYLESLLKSIESQTFIDYELIIYDGNSSDSTVNILRNQKIDYWISEKDNGIYDAMNKAVKFARGRWVYFIGADDELLPDFSVMCGLLNDEQTIYYGNVLFRNKVQRGVFYSYKLAKKTIDHQCIFYPKSVFDLFSYDLKYKIGADYVLNIKLWHSGKYKFQYHNLLIANYNDTGISTLNEDKQLYADKHELVKNHFSRGIYWLWRLRRAIMFFKKHKLG